MYVNGDSVESFCRASMKLRTLPSLSVCVCMCIQITNSIYHGVTRCVNMQVSVCDSDLPESSRETNPVRFVLQMPTRGEIPFALQPFGR